MNPTAALLSLVLPATAAAQIPAWVAEAPGADAWPDTDGLVLRQVVEVDLAADGKVGWHREEALRALTGHLVYHDRFDPRIDWNDARAELSVDLARTWMADGTLVEAAENSIVPNTAGPMQWAVPYAHLRQVTVAQVGVEHGAISELGWTLTDREPAELPLWGLVDLQDQVPVLDQRVSIAVPGGTKLVWGCRGCEVELDAARSEGVTTHLLEREAVPAYRPEQGGHSDQLVFSSATSWDEVRELLGARVDAALTADPSIEAKVGGLLRVGMPDPERLAELHGFVVDGVRTVHWPLPAFDYQVRPAAEVLDSSVGHSLDKAVLLLSLVRAAGFEADVALVSSRRDLVAEVPCPDQLDQAWVQVLLDGRELWLDPTSGSHDGWDLAGHPVFVLGEAQGGPVVLPDHLPADNRGSLRLELDAEDGGRDLVLTGQADLDLARTWAPSTGFDREGPGTSVLAGVASGLGGMSVDDLRVARLDAESTSLRAALTGGALDLTGDGPVRLVVPRVPGAVTGEALQLHREQRVHPLVLPHGPRSERVELVLELPEGVSVVFAPQAVELSTAVGTLVREVEHEGQTLTVRTELSLVVPVVEPGEYPALRRLLAEVESASARTVLLDRD